MILSEGRKEDVYQKFKKQIDLEREITSIAEKNSFYDMLIKEPFMVQTNFKYLEPLIKQHYFWFKEEFPLLSEKEKENYVPKYKTVDSVFRYFNNRVMAVEHIIKTLMFFEKNKDKYPKKDLNQYVGDNNYFDDFLLYTDKLIAEKEKKDNEKKARKDVDKIYENDSFLIVKPKSHVASCYYGAGTRWCTTMKDDESYFTAHTKKKELYYIIFKNLPSDNKYHKIAINVQWNDNIENGSFWNANDDPMTNNEKKLLFSLTSKDWVKILQDDLNESSITKEDEFINEIKDIGPIEPVISINVFDDYEIVYETTDFEVDEDIYSDIRPLIPISTRLTIREKNNRKPSWTLKAYVFLHVKSYDDDFRKYELVYNVDADNQDYGYEYGLTSREPINVSIERALIDILRNYRLFLLNNN